MGTKVLNDKLLKFSQKYVFREIPISKGVTLDTHQAYNEVVAELAEQLLLFDIVIIKLERNNYPVSILINELGLQNLMNCIENGSIQFLLWTPMMLVGKKHQNKEEFKSHDTYPLVAGYYSDPIYSEPEAAMKNAFNWVDYNYERKNKREFVRRAAKRTVLVDSKFSDNSLKVIADSYKSNALNTLGIPYESTLYDLEDEQRGKMLNLASEISDLNFIASYDVQSYNHFTVITLFNESLAQIRNALKTHDIASEVYKLEALPNFKEVYKNQFIDFNNIVKLRNLPESKGFRKWLNGLSDSNDYVTISKEYLDFISKKSRFFDTTGGKFVKDVTLMTTGALVGSKLVAVSGGILALPIASKAADFGLNFLSSLVFDKLVEGWQPRMFAENIRDIIKKEY